MSSCGPYHLLCCHAEPNEWPKLESKQPKAPKEGKEPKVANTVQIHF